MMLNSFVRPKLVAALGLILACLVVSLIAAAGARADFGIDNFVAGFQDSSGNPVTQAAGHPDFAMGFKLNSFIEAGTGMDLQDGQIRDMDVRMPVGTYGDPQAAPQCPVPNVTAYLVRSCGVDTQVGTLTVQVVSSDPNMAFMLMQPVYNITPGDDDAAVLAANVFGAVVKIAIRVDPTDGYRLKASVRNMNQGLQFYAMKMVLWGVPADPSHDASRFLPNMLFPGDAFGNPIPAQTARRAFLTAPSDCSHTAVTKLRANSWGDPDTWLSLAAEDSAPTGCDKLNLEHGLRVQPSNRRVDTPASYDVDLNVHQSSDPDALGTPPLKRVTVKLPEGVALSPSSAAGLAGCADAALAAGSDAAPACPDASKIGTVTIKTPVLPDDITGTVYLGEPQPGALFRLFITANAPGVHLKLVGTAQPDPSTGQITAVFDNLPELPFSVFHLHLKGGPGAPLANPQSCGTKTSTSDLAAYSGTASSAADTFAISRDGQGAPCPAVTPFVPSLEAGTVDPTAGAFSAFTMTIHRNDGDQELSKIAVSLPPGLLGILSGIPQCPEAAAAAGTCDASTQVGTTTVEAGSGDRPLPLTGKVFLAGAYKGAPYSLSIVVRAVAGPFDLGTVVVRAPLNIDAAGGKVAVPADALPTILQGVPLRLRTINVTLDRAGFMFNATNCTTSAVGATLTSVGGAVATPSSRYQVTGCAGLLLNPAFSLRLTERKEMKKGGHPGVVANLSQTAGQAGLKRVEVTLPNGVSVDLKNLGSICKVADAAARKCADSAIVGKASAKTPALPTELTGPVYLVEGTRTDAKTGKQVATLPRLWLKLEGGGVPLDLWGDTNVVNGRVITTFPTIPDAPISSFRLQINGGPQGILMTSREMCSSSRSSKVVFAGQNGAVVRRTIRAAGDCAPRIARTKVRGSLVSLTVSGIGAGRLSVSGSGLRKVTRTLKSADVATITASLSAAAKAQLAEDGRLRVRLAVTWDPSGDGATVTLRKTVVFRS